MRFIYQFSFPVNTNKNLEELDFKRELTNVANLVNRKAIGEHYIFADEQHERSNLHSFSVYGYSAADDISEAERNFDVLVKSKALKFEQINELLNVSSSDELNEMFLSRQISVENEQMLKELSENYFLAVGDMMNIRQIQLEINKNIERLKLNN